MKTKKNWSSPEIEVIFPRNQVKTKKKVFAADGDHQYIKQFFSPGWLSFLWSSSVQLSMGGRQNLDGGTLTFDGGTRPPCNLSTGHAVPASIQLLDVLIL